jgi:toluene monooxygenase system ferredoxin subunit
MAYQRALDLDSLWPGEMVAVCIASTKVLLLNVEGDVLAYEDRCAHQSVQLSKGCLAGTVLTCSAHHWQYDARSGRGLNPEGVGLRKFPVKVDENQIYVDVSDDGSS